MKNTLGAILAKTLTEKHCASVELLRKKTEAESAEGVRKLDLVTAFYETAKTEFEAQIRAGKSKIQIMVGSEYQGKSSHAEVEQLLLAGQYGRQMGLTQIVSNPKHAYYPLWKAFSGWASKQGLDASFEYDYDGGGMSSWHHLTVKASKPKPSTTE